MSYLVKCPKCGVELTYDVMQKPPLCLCTDPPTEMEQMISDEGAGERSS